ncbi:MAG: hypothetical protein ACTSVU_06800 [Promethearchaeota archaeon]
MPSHNPKHQRKSNYSPPPKNLTSNRRNIRIILMVGISLFVIVAVVLFIVFIPKWTPPTNDRIIEDGDEVTMDYKLWIDHDKDGSIDWSNIPEDIHNPFYEVIVKQKDPTIDNSTGLIKAWYDAVLGSKLGEIKSFYAGPSLDSNHDGLDDVTGKAVDSFTTGSLGNVKIFVKIMILKITKPDEITTTSPILSLDLSVGTDFREIGTNNRENSYFSYPLL